MKPRLWLTSAPAGAFSGSLFGVALWPEQEALAMSAKELLERFMAAAEVGGPMKWRKLQREIIAEHEKAPDERDRVLCLDLLRTLMDAVERQINPADLEEFRRLRDQEYIALLLREAMIGETDDNLDPVKTLAITTREVRDGRMREDAELHRLAVDTVRKLGEAPPSGIGAKLRSWFK